MHHSYSTFQVVSQVSRPGAVETQPLLFAVAVSSNMRSHYPTLFSRSCSHPLFLLTRPPLPPFLLLFPHSSALCRSGSNRVIPEPVHLSNKAVSEDSDARRPKEKKNLQVGFERLLKQAKSFPKKTKTIVA